MNHYAKAIGVLNDCQNVEKLLFEIAKKNPSAVVAAYERINGPSIDNKIIKMAKDGQNKIECIKTYRNETGCGLRESKEAVENLVPIFNRLG